MIESRPGAGGTTSSGEELLPALLRVLTRAVRALGQSGQPDRASRLTAEAWSALRASHPAEAEHLNGVLHYLARLPEKTTSGRPQTHPTTEEDTT